MLQDLDYSSPIVCFSMFATVLEHVLRSPVLIRKCAIERGCLMGGIHGMFLAQYEVLRERGHSPSEAFNETVEEATQSLYPLIAANGMDWMYAACSTTARRGAIDWSGRFKDTLKPVFNDLYDSVAAGKETKRSLEFNSQPDYREKYDQEMKEIRELEIWRAGKAVRYSFYTPCPFQIRRLSLITGNSVRKTRSRALDHVICFLWGMIARCSLNPLRLNIREVSVFWHNTQALCISLARYNMQAKTKALAEKPRRGRQKL